MSQTAGTWAVHEFIDRIGRIDGRATEKRWAPGRPFAGNMPPMARRLTRSFYRRDPVTVARDLLGQRLVRHLDGRRLAGIITETEAYLGIPDRAAHTFGGRRTARNEAMWSDGGHCYVYFTYGMHHCVNVVAGRAGDPVAVLLRALEPVDGADQMQRLRGREADLCRGPARLCQALAIDRSLNAEDLVASERLFVERVNRRRAGAPTIVARPRVGIAYAGPWARRLLRFYLRGSRHVSRT
jgi:DNA-3-methyladenine glycosylase